MGLGRATGPKMAASRSGAQTLVCRCWLVNSSFLLFLLFKVFSSCKTSEQTALGHNVKAAFFFSWL